MISKIDYVKRNFNKWNKKTELKYNNQLFKVIGAGNSAFKILWFGNTPGSTVPGWNQGFWGYKNLDECSKNIINQIYKKLMGGQTTL